MTPLEFDRDHLWHPYTNVAKPGPAHLVKEAEGIWLTLDDGTRVIDAMSSWWCTIHGHRHPQIVQAMHDQLDRLPHVMFGGLTHDPAVELGKRLISMLPDVLNRVFYCDSGSVSVEVAMKMAVQYQMAMGRTGRTGFATIRGGYHGDTWKAMSVCDPVNGMHGLFRGALGIEHFLPRPSVQMGQEWPDDPALNGVAEMEALLTEQADNLAAVILEPVVQGAGGMYFYHPQYLVELRKRCDQHGILLIFDEIATGFGRTGKAFALEHAGVVPDIICLGKALTGGHISFAATVATKDVAYGIGESEAGVFMHGPTFMGNPLACAAACASLDLMADGAWQTRVAQIEAQMREDLEPARDYDGVVDVRVLGAIGVIQMAEWQDTSIAHRKARQSGVYLRPFAHNIYTMPPFITEPEDLSRITTAMLDLAKGP